MTEEELNESIIKNKIQGICQDCIYLDKIIPIINQMLKEEYIKGLEQGKLDKEMEKQQLISCFENKIKEKEELLKDWKLDDYNYNYQNGLYYAYKEILNLIEGNKND